METTLCLPQLGARCLCDLQTNYEKAKAGIRKEYNDNTLSWEPAVLNAMSLEDIPTIQKLKRKTRRLYSATAESFIPDEPDETDLLEAAELSQIIMTDKYTVEMFSKIFNKTISRSPVDWVDFEAGLAKLGFMVLPRNGSVYTFYPPNTMNIQTPLVLQNPHQSRVEGYRSLIFARRLRKLFGWWEATFQVEGS
jgi:hypothetical protein